MNSISLFKYYKRATLLPFAGTIVGGIVLVMLHDDKELQTALLADDNFGDTVFLMVLFSFSICILSLTIFLSRYKQVTDSAFLHLLTWMVLPLGVLGVMLYNQVNFLMEFLFDGWEHPPYETQMQILFVFVCAGHILGNIISFIQFRRKLARQKTQPVNMVRPQTPPISTHHTPLTHHR